MTDAVPTQTGRFEVCIVGAGPTGLTAANLLGARGVRVLLVERHAGTSNEAKAISLDDESMRSMQRAGLVEVLSDVVLPGTGTRYYGARGQELCYARGPRPLRNGHAFKSPFAQPELERILLTGLARFPGVDVRFGTELVGFEVSGDTVELVVRTDGRLTTVRSAFLVGCDGGRSTVREVLGVPLLGSSFSQRWLVVDTLDDHHDERYGMHHGDPDRPHVIIPGRQRRCRYEFLLKEGEAPDGSPTLELIRDLLRPYRTIEAASIERTAVYRFHALTAQAWRRGPVFLAGDAAHMMPPFAGQGLNSGVRDVANLTWKLAEVLGGRAGDRLLDSYELERRPHAQAMTDLSVRLGRVVMTTSRWRAWLRDVLVRAALLVPPGRRYLEEMRFRPPGVYADGFVVGGHGAARLAGTLLPQPQVLCPDGRAARFDAVLGDGYALIAVDPARFGRRDLDHRLWDLVNPRPVSVILEDRFPAEEAWPVVSDYDGGLRRALGRYRGQYLLVRPDRFVAAAFPPDQATAVADQLVELLGWSRGPLPGSAAAGQVDRLSRPAAGPAGPLSRS